MSAACADLDAAYRSTVYRIRVGERELDTRIGDAHPTVARLLAEAGQPAASLLTACNPRSLPLTADANALRQAALHGRLRAGNWNFLPAEGCSVDGLWREAGYLVIGLHGEPARRLALDFDQIAWVEYDAGGLATLRYSGCPAMDGKESQ